MTDVASKYLVIRVSQMDDKDAIAELNKVVREHGHAWFGKYGRPIGVNAAPPIVKNVILLSGKYQKATLTTYKLAEYRIAGMSRIVPTDRLFPDYYASFIHRIRTWIKVVPTGRPPSASIDNLVVVSSYSPLRDALYGSMSSHFVCRVRNQ